MAIFSDDVSEKDAKPDDALSNISVLGERPAGDEPIGLPPADGDGTPSGTVVRQPPAPPHETDPA